METETTQTTLRDKLESNFEKMDVDGEKAKAETPPPAAAAESEAPASTEAKPERPRDETGKFAKVDKATKPEAKAPDAKPEAPAPEAKPRPPRPSTWKKDYWDHWEKLDPALAEYIHQREGEYAKGVSSYKAEYDRLKPVADAIAPYQPFLQQSGMTPDQFVRALAETDRVLRFGSKEEKLRTFAKFAQDYEIPMHEMLVQGEDGKIYFNQQYLQAQQHQATQQSQGLTPQQVEQLVQQKMQQAAWLQQVQSFRNAKDASGNPLHPHVSEVEVTMAGLLRAGLAKDLDSAYDAALRMPQHAALFDGLQKQQAEAKAAADAKAKAEAAARARASAVSVKGQSPTGIAPSAGKTRKGLRETLAEGVEALSGNG